MRLFGDFPIKTNVLIPDDCIGIEDRTIGGIRLFRIDLEMETAEYIGDLVWSFE